MATRRIFASLGLLAGCAFAGSAGAVGADDEYRSARNHAQGIYKNAWENCRRLAGTQRDICRIEARGSYDVAKAELEAKHKRTPKREDQVGLVKAGVAYKMAAAKCGDLSGNPRDVCVKEAKASLVAAEADIRLNRVAVSKGVNSRAIVREREDAREDKRDAELAAARQRCETLSGEAKASCVSEAKKKFGKM